jgi:hypothetical protein
VQLTDMRFEARGLIAARRSLAETKVCVADAVELVASRRVYSEFIRAV